jgi:chemotaxis protein histidine kinase CheA
MNLNVNTTPVPDLSHFRPRFLAGLNRRVDELTSYAPLLEERNWLDAAMRVFHSIAGLAGTFGFWNLTTISRQAEITCARALDAGTVLTGPDHNSVVDAITQLRAACSMELQHAA